MLGSLRKTPYLCSVKEDFAERMTTFMTFIAVSSLKNKPPLFGCDGLFYDICGDRRLSHTQVCPCDY